MVKRRNPESESPKKNKKPERSLIAEFHRAPKIYGEKGQYPFMPEEMWNAILDAKAASMDILNNDEVKGEVSEDKIKSPEGKYLYEIIQNALNVNLKESKKDDQEEREKLQRAKERLPFLLDNVFKAIKSYMQSIVMQAEPKMSGDLTAFKASDDYRTIAHNRLIGEINALNRTLNWWFGKIDLDEVEGNLSPKMLTMFEKQYELYITEDSERIDIPQNGICPVEYNMSNRKEITRWAKAIRKDITTISKLSSIINNASH